MLNARVASSFIFSVLIVAVAAVVLYRPEPPLPERPTFQAADSPPPTPGVPWTDPPGFADVARSSRVSTVMEPRNQAPPRPAVQAADGAAHASRPSARSAFVKVAPGESLLDVAVRVYGSKDAAATLWAANRDQLDGPDGPLPPGSVLRAP